MIMYLIYLCFDSGVIKEHFFFLKITFSNLKLYLHLGLTSKQFQWRISSAYFGMGIIVFFYVLCKVTMITWQVLENSCRVEILLTCRQDIQPIHIEMLSLDHYTYIWARDVWVDMCIAMKERKRSWVYSQGGYFQINQ